MEWRSIFKKEISRPVGLGLCYVSAMKSFFDFKVRDSEIKLRIEQKEKEEENIGTVVWDAALCLVESLSNLPCFRNISDSKNSMRILELGSGTGIVGIATKLMFKDAHVVLSDLETDLLDRNVRSNVGSDSDSKLSIVSLPWGDENAARKVGVFDVILCSDTVYEAKSLSRFLQTLLWVTREGESVVYLSYRRRIDEREIPFFEDLERHFTISVLRRDHTVVDDKESDYGTKKSRNYWHNVHILECKRRPETPTPPLSDKTKIMCFNESSKSSENDIKIVKSKTEGADIHVVLRDNEDPKLLILMCHGLHGTIKDFTNRLTGSLERASSSSYFLVLPTCNQGKYVQLIQSNTSNGTKVCAERVLSVMRKILKNHPRSRTLKDIIILGHSFGGIYTRYLLKLLVDESIIPKRLNPLHFISVASPHLGIRRKKGVFFGLFKTLAPIFAGSTGKELLLEDKNGIMDVLSDGPFLDALSYFEQRTCYGNIYNDINVPLCTSTLRSQNPYRENGVKISWEDKNYPGVVKTTFVKSVEEDDASRQRLAFSGDSKRGSQIRDIRKKLISLGWRRVDCKLWGPLGLAHVQIIGQQGGGEGVQSHIADLIFNSSSSSSSVDISKAS